MTKFEEFEQVARNLVNCHLPECNCWHEAIHDASEVINAPKEGEFSKEAYHMIPKIEALQKSLETKEYKDKTGIQILIRTELRKAFERGRRSISI